MAHVIRPRRDIGLPEPPSTRPKLRGVAWLLGHYTGVTAERYARPELSEAAAKSVADYGLHRTPPIPYEYSYLITLDGQIWEQAGTFQAAHCLNFNTRSAAVLFVNGIGVPLTAAETGAWWWLRDEMVRLGILVPGHEVAPHYRFRSTACCDQLAYPPGRAWASPTGEGRLGNLVDPLTIPPDPPTPPPGDDEMTPVDVRAYDSREKPEGAFTHVGEGRSIPIPFATPGKTVIVNLTAISINGNGGFFSVSWDGHMRGTSRVQLEPGQVTDNLCFTNTNPGGAIDVYLGGDPAHQPAAHLIIDVQGVAM